MWLGHQTAITRANFFHRASHGGHTLLDKLELSQRLVLRRLLWPNAAVLLLQIVEANAYIKRLVGFNHALSRYDCLVAWVGDHGKDHDLLADLLG